MVTKTANGNEAVIFIPKKQKKIRRIKIMKKKITELYYTFKNHLNKEEKAEIKCMLFQFKGKQRIIHRPYITGSEKVRDTAFDLGYQVTTKRNNLGYYEVYPNTVF